MPPRDPNLGSPCRWVVNCSRRCLYTREEPLAHVKNNYRRDRDPVRTRWRRKRYTAPAGNRTRFKPVV